MNKGIQFLIIWIAVTALIFLSTFHNRISKNNQKRLVFLLMIIFTFLYSFRTVGLDLKNYENYYTFFNINSLSNILNLENIFRLQYEPVYVIWVLISKQIGLSFSLSQFFYYFIIFSLFYRLIIKYTDSPLVAFMIFIITFMFYFDLSRMMLALGVGLTAFLSNRKLTKVVFYCFAFLCHYTIILLVIYELISNAKFLKKQSMVSWLLWSVLGAFVLYAIKDILLKYSNNRFIFKILYYLGGETVYINSLHKILLIIVSLYPIVLSYYIICNYPKFGSNFNEFNKSINTMKIGVASSIVSVFLVSMRTVSRIMLPAFAPSFILAVQPVAESIHDGKINRKGLYIILPIMLYNVFMSLYYLWVAFYY